MDATLQHGKAAPNTKRFRVGLSCEHIREWGREIYRGIAAYMGEGRHWSVTLLERGIIPTVAEQKGYDGFIWCVTTDCEARKLTAAGRPVVNLIEGRCYKGVVSVVGDAEATGRLAARFFLGRHFSRFAFCGWGGLPFSDNRERFFCDELRKSGHTVFSFLSKDHHVTPDVEYSFQDDKLVLPDDADAIAEWVLSLPKPIAVFCASDYRSWHLCEICSRLGISVPRDVAILGVDNDPVPALMTEPSLSSIDKNTYRNGYLAAKVLDELMSGERSLGNSDSVFIQPKGIVLRESTAVYPLEPSWLSEALSFIHDNVERMLTAADVVEHLSLSYTTVENIFHKRLGTTIQREIMAARIEVAEQLLLAGEMPLAEIARRSGFRNPQYFTNAFRAARKVAPGQWRCHRS